MRRKLCPSTPPLVQQPLQVRIRAVLEAVGETDQDRVKLVFRHERQDGGESGNNLDKELVLGLKHDGKLDPNLDSLVSVSCRGEAEYIRNLEGRLV